MLPAGGDLTIPGLDDEEESNMQKSIRHRFHILVGLASNEVKILGHRLKPKSRLSKFLGKAGTSGILQATSLIKEEP